MGATLADGGVNPLTKERVIDAESGKRALAVMATAGLYETSGDWLYDVGPAGQERNRRRHRHGLARQGRRSAPSLRGSTTQATASRGSSPRDTFRRAWV